MAIVRRRLLASLMVLMSTALPARAQDVSVVDSTPKAQAVIGEPSSEFFVRFDRPIDHIHSQLAIFSGDRLVERLVPRMESAPEVLFARAPTLPPGSYILRWNIRTMADVKVISGDIPFTITGTR